MIRRLWSVYRRMRVIGLSPIDAAHTAWEVHWHGIDF